MKTQTTVKKITHGELVLFFSSLLYANFNWSASYDHATYQQKCKGMGGTSFEDALANMLEAGCDITLVDNRATESKDIRSKYGHWESDYTMAVYTLNYHTLKCGIEKAIDGRFECYNNEYERASVAIHALQYGEFLVDDAELLMQIILFGEVVY